MKSTLALAAIAGLTLAPVAGAQVSCADIRKITAEAKDDFDAFSGEKIEDDIYKAIYMLRGADKCSVSVEWESVYSCLYQSSSYTDAGAVWAARLNEVSSCLSGWTPTDVPADKNATGGVRIVNGKTFAGSGDYEDLEWAVVIEEHAENGSTHYDIWVDLAYY